MSLRQLFWGLTLLDLGNPESTQNNARLCILPEAPAAVTLRHTCSLESNPTSLTPNPRCAASHTFLTQRLDERPCASCWAWQCDLDDALVMEVGLFQVLLEDLPR